jgi:hypothetical protein
MCLWRLGQSPADVVTSADTADLISLRRLRLPRLVLSRRVRFTNRFTEQAIDLQFPAPFPPFHGCHPWVLGTVSGLSFGRALFHRYACHATAMVELLEAAVAEMHQRAGQFGGRTRTFPLSAEFPFVVVLVDELAFLTAYQPDRDLRKRAEAAIATLTSQGRSVGVCVVGALQDPRKDVISLRNLFSTRIALRLDESDQVDMVLGDGARDRGSTPSTSPARDLSKWRSPSAAAGRACGRTARASTPGTGSSVIGCVSSGTRARWGPTQTDGSGSRSREVNLRTSSGLSGKQHGTLTPNTRLCWAGGESTPCARRRLNARGRPTLPSVPAWQKIRPASTQYWPRTNSSSCCRALPVLGRRCCRRSGSACHRTLGLELTAGVTATPANTG